MLPFKSVSPLFSILAQAVAELKRRAEAFSSPTKERFMQRADSLSKKIDPPELPLFLRAKSSRAAHPETNASSQSSFGNPNEAEVKANATFTNQNLRSRSQKKAETHHAPSLQVDQQPQQQRWSAKEEELDREKSESDRLTEEVSQLTQRLSESVKKERESVLRSTDAAEKAERAMERSVSAVKSKANRAARALSRGSVSWRAQLSTIVLVFALFMFAILLVRMSPVKQS